MNIKTNKDRLVEQSVMGSIHHPTLSRSGEYKISHTGLPVVLPSVGGITYNVMLGDCVFDFEADHVEPGVSIKNPDERENGALVTLACVGNSAVVVSGDAKGAVGVVTGFHGGIEHTLCHFSKTDMERMLPGDKILVRSVGQGLKIEGFPDVLCTGIAPSLLDAMGIEVVGEKLVVPVAGVVPPYLMGAGLGVGSAYNGDYDIMTADKEELKRNGLDRLRYGDIVLLKDCDNTYGRGYLSGACAIGIVVHSDCVLAGHGPGVSTLLASKTGRIEAKLDPKANLKDILIRNNMFSHCF